MRKLVILSEAKNLDDDSRIPERKGGTNCHFCSDIF